MDSKDMKARYSYQITLIDGDIFIGEYSRQERGFFVFFDYAGKEHAFRIENVVKIEYSK